MMVSIFCLCTLVAIFGVTPSCSDCFYSLNVDTDKDIEYSRHHWTTTIQYEASIRYLLVNETPSILILYPSNYHLIPVSLHCWNKSLQTCLKSRYLLFHICTAQGQRGYLFKAALKNCLFSRNKCCFHIAQHTHKQESNI